MSGADLLTEIRATLTRLERLPADVARLAAPLVNQAICANVVAGNDPEGKAWLPKKDGGRPLQNAAKAITTTAVGPVVLTTLTGVEVFHHFGRGVPKRRILPDPGTIPPAVEKSLRTAAATAFDRAVRP